MEQVFLVQKCIVVLFLFFAISDTDALRLKNDILEYFISESVEQFRQEWEYHRKAIQVKIRNTLQEQPLHDMINKNIINKESELNLAQTFYYSHGRVLMALNNLQLAELPHFWLPKVLLPLAENIFKLDTRLTGIVINADYTLLRNKSDLIAVHEQDAFRNIPFPTQLVQSTGNYNLSLEGCILSGYILARLEENSVKLGHHTLSLKECVYKAEFNQPNARAPVIVAGRSTHDPGSGFGIKQLLMQRLQKKILKNIKTAIFKAIDSNSISGLKSSAFEDDQIIIFRKTNNILTNIIKNINEKTATHNDGAFILEDYFMSWDDSTTHSLDDYPSKRNKAVKIVRLINMVLTGLDTAYISNSGGPYAWHHVMIGEQIRFQSLRVQGDISHTKHSQDHFKFSVSISDLAVNIDAHVDTAEPIEMEVVGYRKLNFSEPRVDFNPVEGIIIGHLMNKIPKVIQKIIKIDLNEDIHEQGLPVSDETFSEEESQKNTDESSEENSCNVGFVFCINA